MKRTVEEYMALPYTIEIVQDEGSFFVKVKELDGCISTSETRSEALDMIDDAMREWFAAAIEDNVDIPLPEEYASVNYSGKFPLRMPKSLHKKLAISAGHDGVSLNQYIVMLLSERHSVAEIMKFIDMSKSDDEINGCNGFSTPITITGKNQKLLAYPKHLKLVVGGGN